MGTHGRLQWDAVAPRSLFGPLMVLEGRGRQRKKEGGINADEEGDECTQRKVAGEHDGELIAGVAQHRSTKSKSKRTQSADFVPN